MNVSDQLNITRNEKFKNKSEGSICDFLALIVYFWFYVYASAEGLVCNDFVESIPVSVFLDKSKI